MQEKLENKVLQAKTVINQSCRLRKTALEIRKYMAASEGQSLEMLGIKLCSLDYFCRQKTRT